MYKWLHEHSAYFRSKAGATRGVSSLGYESYLVTCESETTVHSWHATIGQFEQKRAVCHHSAPNHPCSGYWGRKQLPKMACHFFSDASRERGPPFGLVSKKSLKIRILTSNPFAALSPQLPPESQAHEDQRGRSLPRSLMAQDVKISHQ